MSQRRTVILVVAIVIGLLAAGALFLYVNDIEDRERAEVAQVEVFRIARDIPRGTPFGEARDFIEADTIPADFRPATAVTNLDALSGQVARFDVASGQVLVQNMFASPSEVPSVLKERIQDEADHVAMSVSIDQVRAVAGLIQPGDAVNLLVTLDTGATPQLDEEGNPVPIEGGSLATVHFFQEVRVIAIGQTVRPDVGDTDPGNQATIGSGLLTFELPPENAARMVHLIDSGAQLYLTLVTDRYVPRPVVPINDANLLPTPDQLTPYADRNEELATP